MEWQGHLTTSEEKKTGPLFQVYCPAIIRTGGAVEVTLNWTEWTGMIGTQVISEVLALSWSGYSACLFVFCGFFFFFFGEVKMHYVIFPSLGNLPRSHSCYIIVLGFNPIYVRPQSPVLKHYNVTLLWQSIGRKMSSYLSCVYIYGMYMVAELRQHTLTCRKWTCRNYFQAFRQR